MCLKHVKRFPTPDSWRILQPTGRFMRCSKPSLQNFSIPRIWDERGSVTRWACIFDACKQNLHTPTPRSNIQRCARYYSRRCLLNTCIHPHAFAVAEAGAAWEHYFSHFIPFRHWQHDCEHCSSAPSLREWVSVWGPLCFARRRARQRLILSSGRIIR